MLLAFPTAPCRAPPTSRCWWLSWPMAPGRWAVSCQFVGIELTLAAVPAQLCNMRCEVLSHRRPALPCAHGRPPRTSACPDPTHLLTCRCSLAPCSGCERRVHGPQRLRAPAGRHHRGGEGCPPFRTIGNLHCLMHAPSQPHRPAPPHCAPQSVPRFTPRQQPHCKPTNANPSLLRRPTPTSVTRAAPR